MKSGKYCLIILLLALWACSETKVPTMELHGELKNAEDGTIVLSKSVSRMNFEKIDSLPIAKGKFSFKRQLQDTTFYMFTLKPSGLNFVAILENGVIKITGDASKSERGYFKVDVEGSYNDSLSQVASGLTQTVLEQEKYAVFRILSEQYGQEKDIDKKSEIKDKMAPYQEELSKEVTALQLEFIKKHINTFAAASVMPWMHDAVSLDELKALYNLFSDRWKKSEVLAETKTDIENKERTLPGKPAPDFTLKDPQGNDISLSSYKGKVVLVDFWASWCRPCRASFPHLMSLYKKYKPMGFEIIGVSNDSNRDKWRKAIKDDGITWVQTVDEFPEKYRPARVATLYAIPYLPTTFLIDRDGVIIGKVHGEDLDKKLEELFK
ncbi:TlpA disulfide reductase family protein [Plebeiibacterium marinum]|uniref:AhpC/TSA family protein n=1 Tax=Plebeiibacterium marinum TaxID=2992111 RepID=A0AAE3MDE8_9BACT|nr:TlpA disulfide reductase family protein [Plebeiobacterium marinum]MCW3805542.1 AhpC/TSA family protein [Plebeiobacterium marinum]